MLCATLNNPFLLQFQCIKGLVRFAYLSQEEYCGFSLCHTFDVSADTMMQGFSFCRQLHLFSRRANEKFSFAPCEFFQLFYCFLEFLLVCLILFKFDLFHCAVAGVQMAVAYVGNVVFPPLFGLLAQYISISLYPWYLLAALVLMAVMSRALHRKTAAKRAANGY